MTETEIKSMLAEEAEHAENYGDVDETSYVRSRRRPKDPSQVYALRIPVNRLEELRKLAHDRHLAPSALMRRWVLERLDIEQGTGRAATRERFDPDGSDLVVMTKDEFREMIKEMTGAVTAAIAAAVKEAKNESQRNAS